MIVIKKSTAKLITELLRKADKANVKVDRKLEETIKEVLPLLEDLELSQKIRLRDHPDLYRAVQKIEREINYRINDWLGFGQYVMETLLIDTYKTTISSTYDFFIKADISSQLTFNASLQAKSAEVFITDTYVTQNILPIAWCKDGKTYSQRLYNNVANFESKLAYVLEQGIEKGKGIDWMIAAWQKLTKAASYEAARLIKTETMAYWGLATKEAYLNMGIEYVEIVGDAACGEICTDYVNSGPILLSEAELGGELPPYHPWCACSFIAYLEEDKND